MTTLEENKDLCNSWTLWAHLPTAGWTIEDYIKIHTINTVGECISLTESLDNSLIAKCSLFYMKDTVLPIWELSGNDKGGVFSIQIYNDQIAKIWKDLMYALAGRCLSPDQDFVNAIVGISVSSKVRFVILKFWMNTTQYQTPNLFQIPKNMERISFKTCLFTRHLESRKKEKRY
jgi:hypothetical protein